jgi:hypothetical protein
LAVGNEFGLLFVGGDGSLLVEEDEDEEDEVLLWSEISRLCLSMVFSSSK